MNGKCVQYMILIMSVNKLAPIKLPNSLKETIVLNVTVLSNRIKMTDRSYYYY